MVTTEEPTLGTEKTIELSPIFIIEHMIKNPDGSPTGKPAKSIYIYPDGHVECDPFEKISIINNFPLCCVPKLEAYLAHSEGRFFRREVKYLKPIDKQVLGSGFPHYFMTMYKTMDNVQSCKLQRQESDSPAFSCGLIEKLQLNEDKAVCTGGKSS